MKAPALRTCAPDFDAAREMLCDVIMQAAPDLDAIFPVMTEFHPTIPASPSAREFLVPEVMPLNAALTAESPGRKPARIDKPQVIAAYGGPLCSNCDAPLHERTSVPLEMTSREAGDAVSLLGYGRTLPLLVSERFLETLTDEEFRLFQIRQVVQSKRSRILFFEICRPQKLAPFVGIAGLDAEGNECAVCGIRYFHVLDPELNESPSWLSNFISRADVPQPLPSMFAVGDRRRWQLCVTRDRWETLRRSRGTHGLISARLGVVDEAHAVRNPRLLKLVMERGSCGGCSWWPEPIDAAGKTRKVFYGDELTHSLSNWYWLRPGEPGREEIVIARESMPLEEIVRGMQPNRSNAPAIFSFRCPECWRLGYISRTHAELRFSW